MKAGLWFAIGVGVTVIAVIVLLAAGWLIWGQRVWGMPMMGRGRVLGRGGVFGFQNTCPQTSGPGGGAGRMGGRGHGMMGRWWGSNSGNCVDRGTPGSQGGDLDLESTQAVIEDYLRDLGYDDLELSEVMEFEYNVYAIAEEPETGIGAMELLVDKRTGTVSPEMGPNMMWNEKYGMHVRRGSQVQENALTEDEALDTAQRWLDANRPGVSTEVHADPFYGYYTIHTLRDGEIEGMLSVHAETGQVWYHTWHGDFVQMMELEEHEHTD